VGAGLAVGDGEDPVGPGVGLALGEEPGTPGVGVALLPGAVPLDPVAPVAPVVPVDPPDDVVCPVVPAGACPAGVPDGFDPLCPGAPPCVVETTAMLAVGAANGVVLGSSPGTVRPMAVVPDMIAAPQFQPRRSTQPMIGSCAIHEPSPTTRQRRPTEMLRNARTTTGSNCAPEHRTSSSRAADTLTGLRYGRTAVITS
jgi:hypothetical protein